MAVSRIQQKTEAQVNGYSQGYGLLLMVLNLVITGIFWWQLPPEIPLFYGMPYGASQLASRWWFLVLPGVSLVIWGVGQTLMKLSVKSRLFRPMMGWIQTLGLFLISLSMLHVIMVTL